MRVLWACTATHGRLVLLEARMDAVPGLLPHAQRMMGIPPLEPPKRGFTVLANGEPKV
jgi:hypothetical protein